MFLLWVEVPKVQVFGRHRVHNDSECHAYIPYMLAHAVTCLCIVTLCLRLGNQWPYPNRCWPLEI